MSLLEINLYDVGQFLRIFLWIFLPISMLSLLVTTYFHYRRKRRSGDRMALSIDGYVFSQGEEDMLPFLTEGGLPGEEGPATARSGSRSDTGATEGMAVERVGLEVTLTAGAEAEQGRKSGNDAGPFAGGEAVAGGNGNTYKGILWMKEKYEQYVEQSDRRYERLREDLIRSEKRYQDLLEGRVANDAQGAAANGDSRLSNADLATERAAAQDIIEEKNRQISFLQEQLEQRIKNYHQLEYQGREDRQRLEELERQYADVKKALEEQQHAEVKDESQERERLHEELKNALEERERLHVELRGVSEEKERENAELKQALEERERQHAEVKNALEERILEIDGWLVIERSKVEDLVTKLQNNSLLLMNIYKELDRSLHVGDTTGQ